MKKSRAEHLLYFSLGETLDRLESAGTDARRRKVLLPVVAREQEFEGDPDDLFFFRGELDLLDMDAPGGSAALAGLLDESPLYRLNLELALDKALTLRHSAPDIEAALRTALNRQPFPHAIAETPDTEGEMAGALRHPVLGLMETVKLSSLYLQFIKGVRQEASGEYGFARVLGLQENRLTALFDGYLIGGRGMAAAQDLLLHGRRPAMEEFEQPANYIQIGKKKAAARNLSAPRDLLAAYVEADSSQMKRCRSISRLLDLNVLPEMPAWVRADVFSILEKESMKQHFADALLKAEAGPALLRTAPRLARAIQINAAGQADEMLQKLLAETLSMEPGRSGAAARFAETAQLRHAEAEKIFSRAM